jgi:hypothetical protein
MGRISNYRANKDARVTDLGQLIYFGLEQEPDGRGDLSGVGASGGLKKDFSFV